MPMVWNAEADAKLLTAIVDIFDVKGEKLKEVAKAMGPECTHKALLHRIAKIRALGKGGEATGGTDSPAKPKTPVKAKKPVASPTKKNGKGAKKQPIASSPASDSDGDGPENLALTPGSARPKRATPKRNYAQMAGEDSDADVEAEDDDGLDKNVKIEVGEDIGEGLREGANEDSDFMSS